MNECKHGHDLTDNVRTRWIRGRIYPVRECLTCIRDRRKKYDLKYHREYTAARRAGTPKVQFELTTEEKKEAFRRWKDNCDEQLVLRAFIWRRERHRARIKEFLQDKYEAIHTKLEVERKAEMLRAQENPELMALIRAQKEDDTYVIRSGAVPYDDTMSHLPNPRRITSEAQRSGIMLS